MSPRACLRIPVWMNAACILGFVAVLEGSDFMRRLWQYRPASLLLIGETSVLFLSFCVAAGTRTRRGMSAWFLVPVWLVGPVALFVALPGFQPLWWQMPKGRFPDLTGDVIISFVVAGVAASLVQIAAVWALRSDRAPQVPHSGQA